MKEGIKGKAQSFFSAGRGRGGGAGRLVPANVCNFLSPDELRVTSLWPDKVGGGAGRGDQVQMPYSLYF